MFKYDAVAFDILDSAQPIPLLAQATTSAVSLLQWSDAHSDTVRSWLLEHGAILFRGFEVCGSDDFESVVTSLFGKRLDYIYRTTLRTQVGKGVYTATDYPSHLTIPFHNENSYQRDWPMHLAFFCVKPADEGGETPIADTLKVTARIPPAIREEFRRRKVMYLRNYRPGVDIPWQTVFQTENRREVEEYCRQHDINWQWKGSEWLQTRQVCEALATHPTTGKEVWFNQAHLFHVSNLDRRTRKAVLSRYGDAGIPRNAYYGDGTPILEEVMDGVRAAYWAEAKVFQWRCKDLLVIDNMRVSHARNPFKGERRVLASMATPRSACIN
jgi:alpha-ketoglutarate-dependent taurine dioxygenase